MTLWLMSPHAPSVEPSVALISAITAFKFASRCRVELEAAAGRHADRAAHPVGESVDPDVELRRQVAARALRADHHPIVFFAGVCSRAPLRASRSSCW